ncbi:TPA: phage antirepressor KilAC domain-containing protein [Escherichia coli]|nr:phage antirepressor KilAC domain-containing protein [Escherichia coli]
MRRQRRSITDIICESRHSNVKVSIDRLVKRGVIKPPALQHTNIINDLGVITGKRYFYVFEGEQGKRDSIVVVAQLSPEFTARLVDRWRELEESAVNIPKTLPEALRLAADLAEQKMQLENQLAIAAPKVEFADRVGEASGILIGNFAKVVGIGPNKLFAWMRDHKILIASGSRRNVPMQEYMDRGYFTVKETAVNTNHGIQISFTTKITGRGQQWLTRKLLDNGMLKVTGEAA